MIKQLEKVIEKIIMPKYSKLGIADFEIKLNDFYYSVYYYRNDKISNRTAEEITSDTWTIWNMLSPEPGTAMEVIIRDKQ